MANSHKISDACAIEAIHTRLWMEVMRSAGPSRPRPSEDDWRPALDVFEGEYYQGAGLPDPDRYPADVENAPELEDWLMKRGLVWSPPEPNDMSIYDCYVRGSKPTLRASLAGIKIDADWVCEAAVCTLLWEGAHFSKYLGAEREHYLERLPMGSGIHRIPWHFSRLIDVFAKAGLVGKVDDGSFTWGPAIKRYGVRTLPALWGDGPNPWEQHKWTLLHVWQKMPMSIKAKHLQRKKALDTFALALDLARFYDKKTRTWRETGTADASLLTDMRAMAENFDRLDREDGLPGRESAFDRP